MRQGTFIVLLSTIASGVHAQSVNSNTATVGFTALNEQGASVRVVASANGLDCGTMMLSGTGTGGTNITLDLSSLLVSGGTINLYSRGERIGSIPSANGPFPWENILGEEEFLAHRITVAAGDEWVWPAVCLLAAIVVKCVEVHVSSAYGQVSWDAEFDCDGPNAFNVNIDGVEFMDISRISIVPSGGYSDQLGDVNMIRANATGGAQINYIR